MWDLNVHIDLLSYQIICFCHGCDLCCPFCGKDMECLKKSWLCCFLKLISMS
ncbi:hypothetical protein RchiOBHm_Chr5g0058221 [Rosa chinensis]|uniref:Uncharacterized protein n=1 Tax=Rosa chinensis TaxID=74649 RepID=A0A2P6QH37_ROSCH|nr:hypothetical protein RchiOBHm_Chr5g0058221 [Rosa chinensis]